MIDFLKGKKIAILGFGVEGKSTLNFLLQNGINKDNITICDKHTLHNIDDDIKINTGNNYLDNLGDFDYFFKSPGISPYTNDLKKYGEKILTQTKLFFEIYNGKIISITQTKGKSTTSSLIYELLNNAGYNVKLVGNIGNPVLDEIDITKKYDFIVYELSSYMLEELNNHHSEISILGNIYPDHLDWHNGFNNYRQAKENIINNSNNLLIGYTLYPKIEKKLLNRNFLSFGGEMAYYSHQNNNFYINNEIVLKNNKTELIGDHNFDNMCGVLGVCDILGINLNIFSNTIKKFKGLIHRLENIGTYKGVIFIDDSISTTPESTIAGIKTFGDKIGTIFLGGTDRGYSFNELYNYLEHYKIKNIVLFPDTGNNIYKLLNNSYNILQTSSMKEAVDFAYKFTGKGKICLLSTASPSYSLWKNFEHQGDEFKKYVKIYGEEK